MMALLHIHQGAPSQRSNIPCPKTTRLQQEADAAERNQASVRLMLREVPSWFKDKMYFATFQDARRMLSMRYRHKSNTVLGHVVLSIHEEGQNRRTKIKGGGSFSAYGSEGPPSYGASSSRDPVMHVDDWDEEELHRAAALSLEATVSLSSLGHGFCCSQDESSASRGLEANSFLAPINDFLSRTSPNQFLEPLAVQGDGFCLFYAVAASCNELCTLAHWKCLWQLVPSFPAQILSATLPRKGVSVR